MSSARSLTRLLSTSAGAISRPAAVASTSAIKPLRSSVQALGRQAALLNATSLLSQKRHASSKDDGTIQVSLSLPTRLARALSQLLCSFPFFPLLCYYLLVHCRCLNLDDCSRRPQRSDGGRNDFGPKCFHYGRRGRPVQRRLQGLSDRRESTSYCCAKPFFWIDHQRPVGQIRREASDRYTDHVRRDTDTIATELILSPPDTQRSRLHWHSSWRSISWTSTHLRIHDLCKFHSSRHSH